MERDSDRPCAIAVTPERGEDESGGCPGGKLQLSGLHGSGGEASRDGEGFCPHSSFPQGDGPGEGGDEGPDLSEGSLVAHGGSHWEAQ